MASKMMSSLLLLLWTLSYAASASDAVLVETSHGHVKGYTDESIHGRKFYAFTGLPFARPPVGELRFKDPEPSTTWVGTLDATKMAPLCSQYPYNDYVSWNYTTLLGEEDCLFLNVFSPKVDMQDDVGLPVMVFIHGGAWITGSAGFYPPNGLMDADVVLVVVQYRLGIMGFLSTEDDFAPGNLGIKDQSLAFRWVQQHISSFGGDRNRVTIFGESAGAASTHFHLLSEHSKGLYHRAIIQSGAATCPWATTVKPAETAATIGEHLGCPLESSQVLVRCLQDKPLEEISRAYSSFSKWGVYPIKTAPYVDGKLVEDHPALLLKEGRHDDVDIMIGLNKDEGSWVSLMLYADKKMFADLNENFNLVAPMSLAIQEDSYEPLLQATEIYREYMSQNIKYTAQENEMTQMFGDRMFNVATDNAAISHIANAVNSRAYKYEFVHRGQLSIIDMFPLENIPDKSNKQNWVGHADELPYLFPGILGFKNHEDSDDQKVSDIMVKLWTNFATTGNPTPDDSLGFVWEPAIRDDFKHLIMKPTPEMGKDQRYSSRQFWNSRPLPENMVANPEMFLDIAAETARGKDKSDATVGAEIKKEL